MTATRLGEQKRSARTSHRSVHQSFHYSKGALGAPTTQGRGRAGKGSPPQLEQPGMRGRSVRILCVGLRPCCTLEQAVRKKSFSPKG